MNECYFTPKKDTTSATICANCGKERLLHTIGDGIKATTVIISTGSPTLTTPDKKMTQLTDNIYAVEIPEDAYDVKIVGDDSGFIYYRIPITGTFEKSRGKFMRISPHGSYTLIFLSKEATDEDWMVVVPGKITGYGYRNYDHKDYNGGSSMFDVWIPYSCKTATESGHSLLRSKGLDPSKNYAIIKKHNQ